MARESDVPVNKSSGLRWILLLVSVLALGAGIWITRQSMAAKPAKTANESKTVAPKPGRNTAIAQPDLLMPDEIEDPSESAAAVETSRPKAKHQMVSWECSGQISTSQAQAVIQASRGQVRNCYERRLRAGALIEGRLNVQVKVDNDGSVAAVRLGGNLRDAKVHACVRSLARSWHFPPPGGKDCALISAPFTLTPQGS